MISIILDVVEEMEFFPLIEDLIAGYDLIDEIEYDIYLHEDNLFKVLDIYFGGDQTAIYEWLCNN